MSLFVSTMSLIHVQACSKTTLFHVKGRNGSGLQLQDEQMAPCAQISTILTFLAHIFQRFNIALALLPGLQLHMCTDVGFWKSNSLVGFSAVACAWAQVRPWDDISVYWQGSAFKHTPAPADMRTCLLWTNRAKTTCFTCGKQTSARPCLKGCPYIPWMVGQCPAGGQKSANAVLSWVWSVLHKIFILSRDVDKAHQLYLYSTKSCKKIFNHLQNYLDS